jgi:hypothetical protein
MRAVPRYPRVPLGRPSAALELVGDLFDRPLIDAAHDCTAIRFQQGSEQKLFADIKSARSSAVSNVFTVQPA